MNVPTATPGAASAAEMLLGRVIDANGAPLDGAEPPNGLPDFTKSQSAGDATRLADEHLETGIKAIDLYAPIARGGTVAMISGSGVGKVVATTELIERVVTRRGGCATLVLLDDPSYGRAEIVADLRSAGIESHAVAIFVQPDDPPELKERAVLLGLALAEDFCAHGREALLVLDASLATGAASTRLIARRHGDEHAALTLLLWLREAAESPGAAQALERFSKHCDGSIAFSRALAKQNIWPAIDPLASASRLLDGQLVGAEHMRVARAAQALLREQGVIDNADSTGEASPLRSRARKVLLFQGQPFVVAETFTGRPGEYVSLEDTVHGFDEIVDGRHDGIPDEAFRFTGTLDQALAQAG
jgi:F-type H+-transporting ATPase subunit beta